MSRVAAARAELEGAHDLQGVLDVADRFVKEAGATEWGAVPVSYRPRSMTTRADLQHWVVRLENCIPSHSAPAIREFLGHAVARIDEIGPHRNAPYGRRYGLAEAVVAWRGKLIVNTQPDPGTSLTDSVPSLASTPR